MLIIDTELAKQVIIQGINKGTTLAKMKDGKTIDLYFRKLKNETYIIAGMDLDNENEAYYIVSEEDIGTEIFPDEEYNNTLNKLEEGLKDVISLLKKAKEINKEE